MYNSKIKVKLLLAMLLLCGCAVYIPSEQKLNYYYLNPQKELSAVGRVAIIELNNESSYPKIAADVTDSLFQALQKKQIFGISIVRQTDPAWRSLQLETGSTYTAEQLSAIRKTLKCNAVLLGTITGYQPFPHMSIGLRLKLVDLKDGQLIWALEQVWDSTDKTTESRMKKYFGNQLRSGLTSLQEKLMTVSPIEFVKFVAFEASETLPAKK
jgi:hypothetical protein